MWIKFVSDNSVQKAGFFAIFINGLNIVPVNRQDPVRVPTLIPLKVQKAKHKKFELKDEKSAIHFKWIIKGLSEKDSKAAREAFKPSLKHDKKYDGSDL
ncbi:hypothetical protein DAPPUDRAFT_244166 [Daphnia pulex]|uniref:Uncharacterized protein n=1 Tax=Daphnia pulex TaxID=6669 RepID=E9GKC8_DAPPU|nr:hypothetical protein DAPPUDRAFT_244166 [Daphnia pulex]|eukprot:EFX79969.1 hypothetical protein DAPPUDRAFT_244166 [Daphnia pulex]